MGAAGQAQTACFQPSCQWLDPIHRSFERSQIRSSFAKHARKQLSLIYAPCPAVCVSWGNIAFDQIGHTIPRPLRHGGPSLHPSDMQAICRPPQYRTLAFCQIWTLSHCHQKVQHKNLFVRCQRPATVKSLAETLFHIEIRAQRIHCCRSAQNRVAEPKLNKSPLRNPSYVRAWPFERLTDTTATQTLLFYTFVFSYAESRRHASGRSLNVEWE